jgi:hypothetical protein
MRSMGAAGFQVLDQVERLIDPGAGQAAFPALKHGGNPNQPLVLGAMRFGNGDAVPALEA